MQLDDQVVTGQRVGEYVLVRKLGQGTFGTVFLAHHKHDQQDLALKSLHLQLESFADFNTFLNEVRTFRLQHPHILPVLDFGIDQQHFPYLVMEYAPKGTLRERHTSGNALPLHVVSTYVKQMTAALQYAHDQHIVHCDVKPENMLIRADDTLALSDFGVSTVVHHSSSSHAQDTIAGTLFYMAPEQLIGQPSPASDQYAFAAIVYEWLTGRRLFQGTVLEIAAQHASATPAPLGEQIPEAVAEVVLCALAKEPEKRFPNIQAFGEALTTAIEQHIASASSGVKSASSAKTVTSALQNKQGRARIKTMFSLRNALLLLLVILLIISGFSINNLIHTFAGQSTRAIQKEQKVLPTATSSPTSTPTPVPTATPTATPSPTPITTPLPTATPVPAVVPTPTADTQLYYAPYGYNGKLVYNDPLTNDSQNMWANSPPQCQFTSSGYEIESSWSCANPQRPIYSNFVVELTTWIPEADQNSCSDFSFRWASTSSYDVQLCVNTSNPSYALYAYRNNKQTSLPSNFSSYIHTGAQANVLGIVADGNIIKLYVNNHFLEAVSDTSSSSGFMQMGCGAPSGKYCLFKNMRVWTF